MKKILFAFIALSWVSVNAQDKPKEFHLDKEYKINNTGTIELSASDAKVFITGSNRSTVHVKIDRKVTSKGWVFGEENFNVEIEEENGNLEIKEQHRGGSVGVVGYYNEEYRIEIEAPEGTSLSLRGDDGDYYVKNINGSISATLDDADLELSACHGDNFRFRMDDGDVRMDSGKGSLEIDADDSDVKIYHAQFRKIDAHVDDGDLIIETSLTDNGEYFLEAEDGSVALNITSGGGLFEIRHEDGRVITEGDFKTTEDSEHYTKLTLASGSAKVNMRAEDARVKLTTSRN